MHIALTVLGQEIQLDGTPEEERRLRDLAAALETRLAGFGGDAAALRCLVLAGLSLLDEVQTSRAALARAQAEVDRLTDLLPDVSPAPTDQDRGRVGALRVAHGSA